MSRPALMLLCALGLLGAAVSVVLRVRGHASFQTAGVPEAGVVISQSSAQPKEARGESTRATRAPITATRRPFVPPKVTESHEVTLSSRLEPYGPLQASIIRTVARLLDDEVPVDLLTSELDPAVLVPLQAEVDKYVEREEALRLEHITAGATRAEEVYQAGRWDVFYPQLVTVEDPRYPGTMVTRQSSPFDDSAPDHYIMQKGVQVGDRVEQRMVRLTPEADSQWAAEIARHDAGVSGLRQELRQSLTDFFRRK